MQLFPAAIDELDPVAVRVVAFAELMQTRREQPLVAELVGVNPSLVDEPVIHRAEVVALLFNVSDIASSLEQIERLLGEDDGEEEDDTS